MKIFKKLYFWIILAFIAGIFYGFFDAKNSIRLEFLSTNFIKLLKVFISPLVFFTVVAGIAQTGSIKKLGKIGFITFFYFEIISTIALIIGWLSAHLFKPGATFHANIEHLETVAIENFLKVNSQQPSLTEFIINIIPTNILEPFLKNDLLQILLIAIFFGISLILIGEKQANVLLDFIQKMIKVIFECIRLILYFSPIAVFSAIAYAIAKFGPQTLIPLLSLVGTFYFTGLIFVIGILGCITWSIGFSIFRFLKFMMPEILIVLGTSSSEAALPQLLKKLENLGCKKKTIGLVVPTGYSFNLDGTNIYIILAALFLAQALQIELTLGQQILLLSTAMLTSKGAAGVTGSGFIMLTATLTIIPFIPAEGLVLIFGIDRFMSEVRSLVNYIGNAVGALVISCWVKEITGPEINARLKNNSNLRTRQTKMS